MTLDRETDAVFDEADEALVRAIVGERSEVAFRALHRRYAPRVYRIALRMLGAESDAEDAVQEMWLRAIPRLPLFAWRSALGTWLVAIAVNTCREMLERRGRWQTVEFDDDVLLHEPAEAGTALDVERAIASLSPGCRAAFILHDLEGFTHEEIAEQMGYTAGTSKTQVFRARRALRRLLGDPVAGGNIREA